MVDVLGFLFICAILILAGFGIVKVYEMVTRSVVDTNLYAHLVINLAKLGTQPGDVCTKFAKDYTEVFLETFG